MIDFHWLLSSGVLAFLTHLHLSIAGFSSPRDKLGVIICYYVKDDVNILKASQKMPVGKQSLKGTAFRLCALSSVICLFSFKDNRTVTLYHDFLPDRTADGDLLLTFSSNIFNFRRSPSSD